MHKAINCNTMYNNKRLEEKVNKCPSLGDQLNKLQWSHKIEKLGKNF